MIDYNIKNNGFIQERSLFGDKKNNILLKSLVLILFKIVGTQKFKLGQKTLIE